MVCHSWLFFFVHRRAEPEAIENERIFGNLELVLSEHANSQGRIINLKIVTRTEKFRMEPEEPLFNQTEEHQFNQ